MSEVEVLARVERRSKWGAGEIRYVRTILADSVVIPARERTKTDDPDIFIERTSYPAHIKVIGRSDDFALWIDDGCVDVSVPLTPASARALAELLLTISSPERKHTPSAK